MEPYNLDTSHFVLSCASAGENLVLYVPFRLEDEVRKGDIRLARIVAF
jgi:hypothetical protein